MFSRRSKTGRSGRHPDRFRQRPRLEELEPRLLLSAGDLDMGFGTGGKVTSLIPASGYRPAAVAVQTDGKIVMAGTSNGNLVVFRYHATGSPDDSFGSGGKVWLDLGGDEGANAVAIQEDGNILVAGYTTVDGGDYDFLVARLLADNGGLDTSFGGDGTVITGFGGADGAEALAIQKDQRIVVVGTSNADDGDWGFDPDADFALVRYMPGGEPDESFGDAGKVRTGFGADEVAVSVAIDYNGPAASNPHYGKITVAGAKASSRETHDFKFALARYHGNGALDNRFDRDGRLTTPFPSYVGAHAFGVMIQPSGKTVVAGWARKTTTESTTDFALARFDDSGSLDKSFGDLGNGGIATDFGGHEGALSIVIDLEGKLVVAGYAGGDFALARYTADGIPDSTFSGDGKLTTDFGTSTDSAAALAIAPDGKVVAAGRTSSSFALARYWNYVPNVELKSKDLSASEAGPDPAYFVFQRSPVVNAPVRVFYSVSGTATPPSLGFPPPPADYSGIPAIAMFRFVDIPAGMYSAVITITSIDDTVAEVNETVTLTISPHAGYGIGSPSSLTAIIADNDFLPPPTIRSMASAAPVQVAPEAEDAARPAAGIGGATLLLDGLWPWLTASVLGSPDEPLLTTGSSATAELPAPVAADNVDRLFAGWGEYRPEYTRVGPRYADEDPDAGASDGLLLNWASVVLSLDMADSLG